MDNEFVTKLLILRKNKVIMFFSVPQEHEKFFNSNWLSFEFDNNIEGIPMAVAISPFVILLAPLIWTLGLIWRIDTIDYKLYSSLKKIKTNFETSNSQNLKGEIICGSKIKFNKGDRGCGLFFSGGVDATFSYLKLYQQINGLIVLKGFDFPLQSIKVWRNFSKLLHEGNYLNKTIDIISSPNLHNINFTAINEEYNHLTGNMSWWTYYEVGLYTLAHSTIPAFIRSYSSVFLSSSYPLKSEPLFGATGSIVNSLELSWCNFKNVGDEYTRLEKISQITRILKNKSLRVCWKSRNGINCCNCEKCSRTIIGLYICGANVKSYGFNITMDWFNNLKNEIIKYTFPAINDWLEMKEYIKSNAELVNDDNVNWIIDFDFIKIHEYNSNRKNMTKRITNW